MISRGLDEPVLYLRPGPWKNRARSFPISRFSFVIGAVGTALLIIAFIMVRVIDPDKEASSLESAVIIVFAAAGFTFLATGMILPVATSMRARGRNMKILLRASQGSAAYSVDGLSLAWMIRKKLGKTAPSHPGAVPKTLSYMVLFPDRMVFWSQDGATLVPFFALPREDIVDMHPDPSFWALGRTIGVFTEVRSPDGDTVEFLIREQLSSSTDQPNSPSKSDWKLQRELLAWFESTKK